MDLLTKTFSQSYYGRKELFSNWRSGAQALHINSTVVPCPMIGKTKLEPLGPGLTTVRLLLLTGPALSIARALAPLQTPSCYGAWSWHPGKASRDIDIREADRTPAPRGFNVSHVTADACARQSRASVSFLRRGSRHISNHRCHAATSFLFRQNLSCRRRAVQF